MFDSFTLTFIANTVNANLVKRQLLRDIISSLSDRETSASVGTDVPRKFQLWGCYLHALESTDAVGSYTTQKICSHGSKEKDSILRKEYGWCGQIVLRAQDFNNVLSVDNKNIVHLSFKKDLPDTFANEVLVNQQDRLGDFPLHIFFAKGQGNGRIFNKPLAIYCLKNMTIESIETPNNNGVTIKSLIEASQENPNIDPEWEQEIQTKLDSLNEASNYSYGL